MTIVGFTRKRLLLLLLLFLLLRKATGSSSSGRTFRRLSTYTPVNDTTYIVFSFTRPSHINIHTHTINAVSSIHRHAHTHKGWNETSPSSLSNFLVFRMYDDDDDINNTLLTLHESWLSAISLARYTASYTRSFNLYLFRFSVFHRCLFSSFTMGGFTKCLQEV